jgi:hypothetical protein
VNDWDGLATRTTRRTVRDRPAPEPDTPGRRPRLLISTPIVDFKLYALDEWIASIRTQVCDLDYDLTVIDNTDRPKPGYLDWLARFPRSHPLGRGHRVRVRRFGEDVDGARFRHAHLKIARAHQMGWEAMQARATATRARDRYDAIVFWECDVLAPPHALQTLWDSQYPWAAAWMRTRPMVDQRDKAKGVEVTEMPLLWRGLTPATWTRATSFDDLVPLGFAEPPAGDAPFACSATHLGLTMVRGEVVRRVPFAMTTAGGDLSQSWAVVEGGYPLMCVPAVRCVHVCDWQTDRWAGAREGKSTAV